MLMGVIDNEARTCPGSEVPCLKDGCAMYVPGYGCRFALIPPGYRPLPSEGKYCPLFRQEKYCGEWCAFFRDGGCAGNAVKVSKRRTTKKTTEVL